MATRSNGRRSSVMRPASMRDRSRKLHTSAWMVSPLSRMRVRTSGGIWSCGGSGSGSISGYPRVRGGDAARRVEDRHPVGGPAQRDRERRHLLAVVVTVAHGLAALEGAGDHVGQVGEVAPAGARDDVVPRTPLHDIDGDRNVVRA